MDDVFLDETHTIGLPPEIGPECPVFGTCGGCQFQHLSYDTELSFKEQRLKDYLGASLDIADTVFDPIVASPLVYHYRSRLDLKLVRTRQGAILLGFTPAGRRGIVPIEHCPLAMPAIDEFLPQLRKEAGAALPKRYRMANIVVKTGDDGRVQWGGIGRGSLRRSLDDALWTKIHDIKIHYGLDTFFQANLSILPKLIDCLHAWPVWNACEEFWDVYAGVGLFGLCMAHRVKRVVCIEQNRRAVIYGSYNAQVNGIKHAEFVVQDALTALPTLVTTIGRSHRVLMVDPPRAGLTTDLAAWLAQCESFEHLLYLSCHPVTLRRDLVVLTQGSWRIERIRPFDFFPRTRHLEILVHLRQSPRLG